MKLMHKLTVKETRGWKSFFGICVVRRLLFLLSTAIAVVVARYLQKTWRTELSWSSLNEHLINHPYNARCLSLLFPLPLVSVAFVIFKKSFNSFYHKKFSSCCSAWLYFRFVVGRLLMAIKISQKINVLASFRRSTPIFPLFFSYSSRARFIPRSMVCDNG